MTKYLTSVNAVAEACDIDWRTAKKWTRRAGFPKRLKRGWRYDKVLSYAAEAKEHAAAAQTGDNADLKAEKLKLECERLREVIRREHELSEQAALETATRKGDIRTVGEVKEIVTFVAQSVRGGLANWIQRVELRGDAELAAWADQMHDEAFRLIQAEIDILTEQEQKGEK